MGIVDLVTVRQVAQLLREIYDDGCRRCAEDLQQFTGPLNDWVDELLQRQLPDNWRELLRDYLAEQEPKGYRIEPENLRPLEDWIHDWAEYRGLLPTTGGEGIARTESDSTDQPFVMAFAPNASGPPGVGGAPVTPAATFVDGVEVAGPGPEVTASFKAKVQQALDILDPRVGNWWQANSVRGLVRAGAFWLKSYESRMEANEQPVVIVDQNYTAGQTAQAIIAEVSGGWFADSIGAFYKKYKFARTGDYQEFLAWQQGAVGEAAKLASVLAEFYINGIATLTPAGDLIVTLGDVAERGPRWDQLISVLPYVSYLPIGAIVFKLGAREIKLPKPILKQLDKLSSKDRKALLAKAAAGRSDDEALAIIKRGLSDPHGVHAPNAVEATVPKVSSTKDPARNTDVYLSKKATGEVQYVGIANQFARRAADHLRQKGIRIDRLMKDLPRSDARAVEQALIEIYGLEGTGGTLLNKINAISARRPDYAASLKKGLALLKSIGYTE